MRRREPVSAPSARAMIRIGILAGGGRLPLMIAESVAARGEGVHIVAIAGEADPGDRPLPAHLGQLGPDRPHGGDAARAKAPTDW